MLSIFFSSHVAVFPAGKKNEKKKGNEEGGNKGEGERKERRK